MPSLLQILFQPVLDALSPFTHIPLHLRLRLLALQPLTFITYALAGLPHPISRAKYQVIQVPLPPHRGGGSIRCLVFQPPPPVPSPPNQLRPLHISIHGGAFIGGFAENAATFCSRLCRRANCVAVSISYRFAPAHPYPTAHDDVRDVVRWICAHAARWGADGSRITVSGSSAGANLGLDLAVDEAERERLGLPAVDCWVGFVAPLELRIPPWEKEAPPGFPRRDPSWFLLPLFDAYGASAKQHQDAESRRANPCLRSGVDDLAGLPKKMLFLIAGIDILLKEQLDYVHVLESSLVEGRKVGINAPHLESKVFENGFHGWTELPDCILPAEYKVTKHKALERAIEYLHSTIKQSLDEYS